MIRALLRLLAWVETWPALMDDWTSAYRDRNGLEPDWDVERRRARRRVQP